MRKIILAVVGAFVALFGLFGVQVGLSSNINEASIVGALLILGAYIFTEFKKDWADFRAGVIQSNRWGDPAFWTAAISSVVLPLLSTFGVTLSESVVSIVAAVLAVLVPVFIQIFRKTETPS
jgi:hypothetical protein